MARPMSDTTPASADTVSAASPNPRIAYSKGIVSEFPHFRRHGLALEADESGELEDGTIYNTNSCANDPILVAEEKATQRPDSSREDEAESEVVYSSRSTFPALPIYGPPSFGSSFKALLFRIPAFFLSLAFLCFVVIASIVTSIPRLAKQLLFTMTTGDANKLRPHYEEERRRAEARWHKQKKWEHKSSAAKIGGDLEGTVEDYPPTEGGKDRLVCDVAYYARRVGLEVDVFHVRTEDGFLIDLWHVYDPKDYMLHDAEADAKEARQAKNPRKVLRPEIHKPKFPVLLIHGLLQSSGAFCCNDDESLAFWLCKSGFDVWLGNNRCGSNPSHESLKYSDPRMWSWTIQHMGIHDLPALTDEVLAETGLEKLGLVCHSQGTAQTLVALSKGQRPELGQKLTVFCALAPAAYAGPLVKKYYFRLISQLSPRMHYLVFGRHAFIPLMMQVHSRLNSRLYGWLGYQVFSFLFDWTDSRWDRGLRDRLFQFAPVYVSSESMRWWLGKDGFASHKCILSPRDVAQYDEEAEDVCSETEQEGGAETADGDADLLEHSHGQESSERRHLVPAGASWYDEQVPPFAMWVCGSDQLVDGKRLLRRFGTGQEPHVRLVHSKVIEHYEHLDVIWAMDAVEQVFREVRDVLWRTCYDRETFRTPAGCDGGCA